MNLNKILEPVRGELKKVRDELEKQLGGIIAEHTNGLSYKLFIKEIIDHIFINHGKMLRPALVILSADMTSGIEKEGPSPALIQLAAAVEMIHAASLIHDDVIDGSERRRSGVSLNGKYGNRIAILSGDILFSQVFKVLLSLSIDNHMVKLELFDLFCNVTQDMCVGELGQHKILTSNKNADFTDYLDILKGKTASFMSACCRSGAVLAGGSGADITRAADFGESYGMAFQLTDDLHDMDAVYRKETIISRERDIFLDKARTILSGWSGSKSSSVLSSLCDFLSG